MPELDNNHYLPRFVLDNFSIKISADNNRIYAYDLEHKFLSERNTKKTAFIKNFYDDERLDDIKTIEKKLNSLIETPVANIFKKIISEEKSICITRKELELIKKYMLTQIYRNLRNSKGYELTSTTDEIKMSKYNKLENESELDFWKTELLTIIETDFDELIKNNLVGVRQYANEIYTGFLMFFRTNDEFIINDSGLVAERVPYKMSKEFYEKAMENADLMIGITGRTDYKETLTKEYENGSSYLDNMLIFPIASNYFIACVHPQWKNLVMYPEIFRNDSNIHYESNILINHLNIPKCDYVNIKLMTNQASINKYKHPDDKYTYKINVLNNQETIYINLLTMNEAYKYIIFKNLENVINSISVYIANQDRISNIKNDYKPLLEQIKKKMNIG